MSNEIKKDELKNKGVKSNEVKSTDLITEDGEVLKVDRDKLLKFSKKMSIEGWTYASGEVYNEKEDRFEFITDKQFGVQFRTFVETFDEVKNETIDELHTMKLNLPLEVEEINKMVGKVYLFDDLDKYPTADKRNLNFGRSKMPTEIKELEGQEVHELIVETRNAIKIRKAFNNVKIARKTKNGKTTEKKVETGDCTIQARVMIENGHGGVFPQLQEIIVRKVKAEELEELIGKKLVVKNLETYVLRGKTVVETKVKPSL